MMLNSKCKINLHYIGSKGDYTGEQWFNMHKYWCVYVDGRRIGTYTPEEIVSFFGNENLIYASKAVLDLWPRKTRKQYDIQGRKYFSIGDNYALMSYYKPTKYYKDLRKCCKDAIECSRLAFGNVDIIDTHTGEVIYQFDDGKCTYESSDYALKEM